MTAVFPVDIAWVSNSDDFVCLLGEFIFYYWLYKCLHADNLFVGIVGLLKKAGNLLTIFIHRSVFYDTVGYKCY